MKAPSDTKSVGPGLSNPDTKSADPKRSGPLTWSDADITMSYHRRKLDTFLNSDLVTTILEIRLLGQLCGPPSPLQNIRKITDAITALVTLLREAGMVA